MNETERQDARILGIAAPMLIPLLEAKLQDSYERLLADFRSGETQHMARIAECNAYTNILDDIKLKLRQLEHEESKKG